MIASIETTIQKGGKLTVAKKENRERGICSYELITESIDSLILEKSCLGDVIENVVYENGFFQEESATILNRFVIATYFEHCCLRMKAYSFEANIPTTAFETNANSSFAFVDKSDSSLVYCRQTEFSDSLHPFVIESEIRKASLVSGREKLLIKKKGLHLPERLDLLSPRDSISIEIFTAIGY